MLRVAPDPARDAAIERMIWRAACTFSTALIVLVMPLALVLLVAPPAGSAHLDPSGVRFNPSAELNPVRVWDDCDLGGYCRIINITANLPALS